MYKRLLIFFAKVLIKLLRLTGRSGSALPGLLIERLYPNFLSTVLQPVEKKIILVTGTNGKTTTTKMLVEGLRATGHRVVTNGTGSNMTRGLISAVVEDMSYLGGLRRTDWFVFEMDEAYAPIFTAHLSPYITLALNVLRDQLDRYGEVDSTAKFIAAAARKSDIFIYSQIDPLLASVATQLPKKIRTRCFGIEPDLYDRVTNEQTIHGQPVETTRFAADVVLTRVVETSIGLTLDIRFAHGGALAVRTPLRGFHNALNIVALFAVIDELQGVDNGDVATKLAGMGAPFGRGEQIRIDENDYTVALVKNPSGFTSTLRTFVCEYQPGMVLFVVNDKLADGRDVSWLWDVTFKGVIPQDTILFTSGIRGADMALRLKQDGLASEFISDVSVAIERVVRSKIHKVTIIPTYTALFEVRDQLGRYTEVPNIW